MTHLDNAKILTPEEQRAVSFIGMMVQIRLGGPTTAGQLAILEHHGERGHGSPVHRHEADDETFLVLDGELRVEVDGRSRTAGAGMVAFLPRQLPHAFVVTSPQARYLTVHQPAGFDEFVRAAGTRETAPDPAELKELARQHNIEILGPPIAP
jgi:quercetin dioxygenase-like cupin family protein